MTVSIVIPVFNEQDTVSTLLEKVFTVGLPPGFTKEVIVVNDGSSDATSKRLAESKYKFKLLSHVTNVGKGAAVRTGISKATGTLLLIQDADLEYDPGDYKRLLTAFKDPSVMAVYGSRLLNYPLKLFGENKTPLPLHWLANKSLTLLTNLLYGNAVTDMETCYKIVRLDLLRKLKLESNKFDLEPEITAKILKKGITIKEIPIKVKPRSYDQGKKIGWRDGVMAVFTLIKYRFRD